MADRDAYLTDPAARDVPVDLLLDPERIAALAGADRPAPGQRSPGRLQPAGRRHGVPGHGRRRWQRRQPHRVELPGVRLRRRRSGDRDPLPEPGQLLQPGPGPPERPRAAQADAPHAAPRDAVPERARRAVDRRGLDGWRCPAAGPRPVRQRRRGRRARHPDRHRRAALLRRASAITSRRRPPSPWSRVTRRASTTRCARSATSWSRPPPSTRTWATSMRSSLSPAVRPNRTARWRPRRTRAARGCRPSGRDGVVVRYSADRWQAALTHRRHRLALAT